MTNKEIEEAIQVVQSRDFGDYMLCLSERQAVDNLVKAAEKYMELKEERGLYNEQLF